LVLADLSSTALRKLGVERGQLIDTEKDRYPQTRVWAEAIHAQCPDVGGLCWVSRQDDRSRALVLFGDRVQSTDLAPYGSSITIVRDPAVYISLLELADRIGVQIVDGKI
jgi:RES domain